MGITYKKCSEVDDRFIFQAFMDGFSDYMVKFQFEQEEFILRFFGPEGNSREFSFIAFDGDQPAGVILGGIKTYESIKTMRCGTLAIHPEYRGKGVSQRLFELHKEEAERHGCKQLFLEVIVGNDRAINFYKRIGYEKIYDIVYYSNSDLSQLSKTASHSDVVVEKIDFASFKKGIEAWNYHINWQNDLEFIAQIPAIQYYGAFEGTELKGALAIHPSGNISFLMVEKAARGQGIGTLLISDAANKMELSRMSAGFPNNSQVEGFLKKRGFVKGSLSQYEMYKVLS